MKYIEKINLNDQDFVFIPPAATAEQIGGIKAENATDENVELKIDEQGKLYAPQYPDFSGKLDKNQGEDNDDKVFVINVEGNLEPTEFKGGSDNRLIANVEKVENANINDSYQAKIENLKLYGKSTQGADPSPTNPQTITAISKFDGAPTGLNIFDIEAMKKQENYLESSYGYKVFPINVQSGKSYTFNRNLNNGYNLGIGSCGFKKDIQGSVWQWIVGNNATSYNKQSFTFTPTTDIIYFSVDGVAFNNLGQFFDTCFLNPQLELGTTETQYIPYKSQQFEYIPTNPMYSTLDGSIADYVDVQSGNEVYNTLEETFNGTESGWQYQSNTGIAFLLLENTPQQQPFCETMQCYKYVENQPYQDGLTINNLGILVIKIEGMTSLQDYKDYLSANPLKVRYGKSVAISTVPIPQEQLAMLRNLYSYTGTTNFLCNAPISFNYEQSVDLVIKDLLNKIQTTGANLLYLNSK